MPSHGSTSPPGRSGSAVVSLPVSDINKLARRRRPRSRMIRLINNEGSV